jgi:hypothetical protein
MYCDIHAPSEALTQRNQQSWHKVGGVGISMPIVAIHRLVFELLN